MSLTAVIHETNRRTEGPVHPIFPNRWSPRAFTDEEISESDLMKMFEAARWAPSSYNNQPWRFIYGRRGTSAWQNLIGLLDKFNQTWAPKAAALVVIASKKTFDNGKPSRTHSYDTGSAWVSLALQASIDGWIAHGMEGFDYDRAHRELGFSDDYTIEAMAAIGRQGAKESLPKLLQSKEMPSDRKKLNDIAFEGRFRS